MDDLYLSEGELRHWLSIEDWYMSSHIKSWMQRTPPDKAKDVLAHIAQDADPEPDTPFAAIAMVLIITGFTPSSAIAGRKYNDRRAGIRAALHLADVNDPRSIPPLCRCWIPGGWRQSKYHEQIEASLIRLLRRFAETGTELSHVNEVQNLVERVWHSVPLTRDLSESRTRMLEVALDYLYASHYKLPESLLQSIVLPETRRSHRKSVQDRVRSQFGREADTTLEGSVE